MIKTRVLMLMIRLVCFSKNKSNKLTIYCSVFLAALDFLILSMMIHDLFQFPSVTVS